MLDEDRLKVYEPTAAGPQTKEGQIPAGTPIVHYDGPSRNQFTAPEIVRDDGKQVLRSDVRCYLPATLAVRDAIDKMKTGLPAVLTRGSDGKTFDAELRDARQMDRRVRLELVTRK